MNPRLQQFLNAAFPTPRFYIHPINQREHWAVCQQWRKTEKARAARWGKWYPTHFRFRFTDGHFWWDFK